MTPGTLTSFEKGKSYKSFVLFVSKKDPLYVNVRMEDGSCFKVEVSGKPTTDVRKLKDKAIELVCTEVTDTGPEFALAPQYYALPAPAVPKAFAPAPKPTAPAPRAAAPARPRPTRGGQTGLKESLTLELKSSLVFSPTTHQPDSDQPFEIAKEIAALMNTAGGDLYLGVDDKGFVTGIEGDLPHLGEAPIMMDKVLDRNYDYKSDFDGFTTKLTTAVRCYLGTAAAALVGQPEAIPDPTGSGLRFVRVPVKPSPDVVYLGREESVVYRAQTSVLYLKGRQRELYVRERFYGGASAGPGSEQIDALLAKINAQTKAVADMQEALRKAIESGAPAPTADIAPVSIPADASIPLEKRHLDGIRSPGGLVFDGAFKGESKSWSDLLLRLLETLVTVDAAKFEALPDEPTFRLKGGRRPFARRGGHAKLEKASPYLGPNGDVRADLSLGTKAGFLQETGIPIRLIRHFGLKPEQFRIWTGKQA